MIDAKHDQHSASLLPRSISKGQARDTGLAMALVCLILYWITRETGWTGGAGVCLVLAMGLPRIFTPLGYLWFGLSNLLGAVVSRLLLSLLFFLVLTPMGLARRLLGKDAMRLRQFKDGQDSVFTVRDHTYTKADVEQPF